MGYLHSRRETITTSGSIIRVPSCRQVIIYNYGADNIYVDDKAIDAEHSFRLDAGLSIVLNMNAQDIYLKAVTSESLVGIVVVKNEK